MNNRDPADRLDPPETNQEPASAAEQELAQLRHRLADYEALLTELPGIFERKYQERQQSLLLQHQLLAKENQSLREAIAGSGPRVEPLLGGTAIPAPPPPCEPEDPEQPGEPPARFGRPSVLIVGGLGLGVGFIALGAGLGLRQRQLSGPQTTPPPTTATDSVPAPGLPKAADPAQPPGPAAAPVAPVAPARLVLESPESTWLQVRTLQGQAVYMGLFQGEKSLPLGRGLEVLAGRPDLLKVGLGVAPPKPLGRIDQITWFRFEPPAPTPAQPKPATPTAPTASP